MRESKPSWLEVLRDLNTLGLTDEPLLTAGNGALGFWEARDDVYATNRQRRCWVHKTANVLNALTQLLQANAKAGLHEIWMAPSRARGRPCR